MGKEVVLTADKTLFSSYREAGLFDFLGCIPAERIPDQIFHFIAPIKSPLNKKGTARVAPYGLRKIEAALLEGDFKRSDVVVVNPQYVKNFIDEETEIVGVSTMDPLGLGPVSMSFTVGGKYTAFSKKFFLQLLKHINTIRITENLDFALVVGGPSVWQLTRISEVIDKLRIDHVVVGETEHKINHIFHKIMDGTAATIIEVSSSPKKEEIPSIKGGATRGIVEVQRGCGRGCQFCQPRIRNATYMALEKIKQEIKVNIAYGERQAWLHSEDIFLYRLQDKTTFHPNREAILTLFKEVAAIERLQSTNPTHCSIAPVVDDPQLINQLTHIILRNSEASNQWIGVQTGLETGSPRLIQKYMANKAKPFTPQEWQELVLQATTILNKNHWFPAYTLVLGLPDARKDDALQTLRLIDQLETKVSEQVNSPRFIITPLTFVPLGTLDSSETFDIYNKMNKYQFAIIYRCWRWIIKEARKDLLATINQPLPIRALLYMVANLGGDLILRELEQFGRKKGFDLQTALNPP